MKLALILCLAFALAYAQDGSSTQPTVESTTEEGSSSTDASTTPTETTTTQAAPETTTAASNSQIFEVKNSTGIVCLVMSTKVFNVSVKCSDTNEIQLPVMQHDSQTSGSCMSSEDSMNIKGKDYDITMVFTREADYYSMTYSAVTVAESVCDVFANKSGINGFRAPVKNVYRCNAESRIEIDANVTLVMSGVRLQAFRSTESAELTDQEYICMGDSTVSNIVPIIVGCALAGLIVIVLVAYVIGRIRRRPYEPVA